MKIILTYNDFSIKYYWNFLSDFYELCRCRYLLVGAGVAEKKRSRISWGGYHYDTSTHWDHNSLLPDDAIWRHRSGSALARIIAWFQTALIHYLNQFRKRDLWCSPENQFMRCAHKLNPWHVFGHYSYTKFCFQNDTSDETLFCCLLMKRFPIAAFIIIIKRSKSKLTAKN